MTRFMMGAMSFLPTRFFEELMALGVLASISMGGLCIVLACYDYSGLFAMTGIFQLIASIFAIGPAIKVGKEFDQELNGYRERREAYRNRMRKMA